MISENTRGVWISQLDNWAKSAARRGPGIKLGICGEHGGDPAPIRFREEVGLDYVSCSPFRVPIARFAAAQAALAAQGRRLDMASTAQTIGARESYLPRRSRERQVVRRTPFT
jgi:phosphoenolpyruvate-protein kinase (PTS system EI component)